MSFDPLPGVNIPIDDTIYRVAEHPGAPGMPYGQEGRAGVVYQLENGVETRALKMFKPRFRSPEQTSLSMRLAPFATLPGLSVCRRTVLTPQRHKLLLSQSPDLTYAILMPWISGPTWMQVMEERTCLTPTQSLMLAHGFASILLEMEQQSLAHCDLSAPNILLPALSSQGKGMGFADIELVDVEQMYAPGFDRPGAVPSGSDGYAHKTVRQEQIWNNKTDRFAGTLLLAEILAWHNPAIRDAAWGQSYFEPAELQHPSRRYDCLRGALKWWNPSLPELLDRTWNSALLADCPTFGEWAVTLPDVVPSAIDQRKAEELTLSSASLDSVIQNLIDVGKRLADQSEWSSALSVYRQAYELAPQSSPLANQIQALIIAGNDRVNKQKSEEKDWKDLDKPAEFPMEGAEEVKKEIPDPGKITAHPYTEDSYQQSEKEESTFLSSDQKPVKVKEERSPADETAALNEKNAIDISWTAGHRHHGAWLTVLLVFDAFVSLFFGFESLFYGGIGGILWIIFTIFGCLGYTNYTAASYRNLLKMRIQGLEYSPQMAFWLLFVPLANLIIPVKIQQEIWKASNPKILIDEKWKGGPASLDITGLNALAILGFVCMLLLYIGNSGLTFIILIQFFALLLAAIIVKNLSNRQTEKAAALGKLVSTRNE